MVEYKERVLVMYLVIEFKAWDGCWICRDPSPHVAHISWWHVAHILIRINLIQISPRVHVARFSYPDSLMERHTTLTNITSRRLPQRTQMTDIYYPDMFVWIIDWSKQVLHVITTACHGPRSATYRVKGQEWSDGKSLPTISDNPRASHDLCQPLVRWWWPCHHLVASWQTQNISLPLKRETKLLVLYIWTFTQRGR